MVDENSVKNVLRNKKGFSQNYFLLKKVGQRFLVKIVGQKSFGQRNNFVKKNLVPQKFWSKNFFLEKDFGINFVDQKKYWSTTICVENKICRKKMFSKTNLVAIFFLAQKSL